MMPEHGLLGDFVPIPKERRPSIFSKLGLKITLQHWKNFMSTTFAIGNIKWRLKSWKPREFINDAVGMYEDMNMAFANGDRDTLEHICQFSMLKKLKGDLKKRVGIYKWKKISDISPARIVQARLGRLSDDCYIFQVVVRIQQLQSISIYSKNGKLIGGDPDKPIPINEYVVYQKISGLEGTPWVIYGKIEETKFLIPYKK
ncbi:39S ribosomal protein L45, mitochondrial [Smittium culicis]|uniref:Large ribosomal subunit protein mL45 n=1 Tax=Smittium culicis TaxID=133412 RepID=A0A1R1YGY4_9FUNG|nr:39S ribosomal protein L45, mitochondrial [Smittium culicis]OMJ26134.1 39S ribosomal protein L45, mitochondrial [Smittium culicis]